MKKIFLSFIAICAMFFCVMSAEAYEPTATSYKVGDEIEVVLGKGIKAKFYVIEDSDSKNGGVTAIYKGVLGEEFSFGATKAGLDGSTAKTKLDELTKAWETPDVIRLIDVSEINDEIDTSSEEDYEFTKPTFLNIGKSYWTETVVNSNGNFKPYVVNSLSTVSTLKTTTDSTAYIRPVIEVSKLYIEGGMVKPKNLDELGDVFIMLAADATGSEIKIEKTENSLKAKIDDSDEICEATFTLEDGILIHKNTTGDMNYLADFMVMAIAVFDTPRFAYDGYDVLRNIFKLSINESYLTVIRNDDNRITEMTADLETLLGWKVETEEETKVEETKKEEPKQEEIKKEEIKEEVKNPKTADTNIIFVTLGLIASGSLIVISKKKLCKNK